MRAPPNEEAEEVGRRVGKVGGNEEVWNERIEKEEPEGAEKEDAEEV